MFENGNSDVPICPHCGKNLDPKTCLPPGPIRNGYTQDAVCRFCDKRLTITVSIKTTYSTK